MEYDDPFRVEYIPKSGDYWIVACDDCGFFTHVPSHDYTITWRRNHKCDKQDHSGIYGGGTFQPWRPQ